MAGDRQFRRCLLELYEAGGEDVLLDRLMAALEVLIPCDFNTCTEIEYSRGVVRGPVTPKLDEALANAFRSKVEAAEILARYIHEHPVTNYARRTGAMRALRISDFLSSRQFHDLALYQEFYRRIGIEEMVVLTFRPKPNLVLATAAAGGRRFPDRDRDSLDQLAPHIRQAYRNATRFSVLEKANRLSHDRLEHAAEHLGLTRRQAEVLRAVFQGNNNAQAARMLGVSPLTVKKHLENIYLALGVTGRMEAVARLLDELDEPNSET